MAAGPFVFPDKAKLNFFSATNLLNTANTFKLVLVSSSYVPNNTADEVYADLSSFEIAGGGGYANGGMTLANDALTVSAGTVKFTCDQLVMTATGSGIPAWRRGVVIASGTLNGKVNPIVGHFLGDNTPADIPATTAGNTLTFTPNASGILSAT